MACSEVYVYGMTVLSTIHQLKGGFPAADGYQEIQQTFRMPGGEGANCAIVLRNLGVSVELDGCYLGDHTAEPLTQYLRAHNVECSRLQHLAGFTGWQDIVFCDGQHRTVFGWFVENLFGGHTLWNQPSEEAIQHAQCIALDPFFGDASREVAELCRRHHKDYVTIDCHRDNSIAQHARSVICSREFLDREYPGVDYRQTFQRYSEVCQGLIIFTFGGREVLYQAPGQTGPSTFTPYQVNVVDTLGAGDTFRAGVVYGILHGMTDSEVVRFASACAALVCTRFPSVAQPPTLEEIHSLMNSTGG
jgi:sugar/nucleoside kinase (ribokinase family)